MCLYLQCYVTFLLFVAVKRCRVWEALLTHALPQSCSQAGGSATLRWALIEPADLTFVSLTLWGASAPCLDHNTISTSEPSTSEAQRSHREAKRHYRWAESVFALQLQLDDFFFFSHCQTTQQETDINLFSAPKIMDRVNYESEILK